MGGQDSPVAVNSGENAKSGPELVFNANLYEIPL
jgi:hypothetical protein